MSVFVSARWEVADVTMEIAKTVDVVDAIVGSHYEIVLVKAVFTFETFLAKQSDVVDFAIGLAVSYKTSAILV